MPSAMFTGAQPAPAPPSRSSRSSARRWPGGCAGLEERGLERLDLVGRVVAEPQRGARAAERGLELGRRPARGALSPGVVVAPPSPVLRAAVVGGAAAQHPGPVEHEVPASRARRAVAPVVARRAASRRPAGRRASGPRPQGRSRGPPRSRARLAPLPPAARRAPRRPSRPRRPRSRLPSGRARRDRSPRPGSPDRYGRAVSESTIADSRSAVPPAPLRSPSSWWFDGSKISDWLPWLPL